MSDIASSHAIYLTKISHADIVMVRISGPVNLT
jgi:hypothetical protein